MKCNIKASHIVLLFLAMTTFSACNGQIKNKKTDNNSIANQTFLADESIWNIYQDQERNYWFGTKDSGVFRYDGKTLKHFTSLDDGLVSNQTRGIQGDHLGNVYIHSQRGISKFDGHAFSTLIPIQSYEYKWQLEPNDLWFKGDFSSNVVYRYDGEKLYHLELPEYDLEKAFNKTFETSSFSPYGVFSVCKDKKGILWIGTAVAGVYRYDGQSGSWISEEELTMLEDGRVPGIRSIIEDKDGNFWFSNILNRYKIKVKENSKEGADLMEYERLKGIEKTKDAEHMDFPYFMSAVIDDENSDLWMQTYGDGVWRYDGEKLFHYPVKNNGKEVSLFSIYKDREGGLWLGTEKSGVYKYNGSEFKPFEF